MKNIKDKKGFGVGILVNEIFIQLTIVQTEFDEELLTILKLGKLLPTKPFFCALSIAFIIKQYYGYSFCYIDRDLIFSWQRKLTVS